MPTIEVSSSMCVCGRCGKGFGKKTGNFPTSYATMHKGSGFLPVCKDCVGELFRQYLSQCKDTRAAVRQMCRKLDLYWNESVYIQAERKSAQRNVMSGYLTRLNALTYSGKCYDDTLVEEGMLWNFSEQPAQKEKPEAKTEDPAQEVVETQPVEVDTYEDVTTEIMDFWGPGFTPEMYRELEKRRNFWMSQLRNSIELNAGTDALIRQICNLEIDINRDRALGKPIKDNVATLNNLLGSLKLKPVQKDDNADGVLANTPLGVWLFRYENLRPLPEVDDDMKDVNGIKKYVFTWMGHVCKMLGVKNGYTKLYEQEKAKYTVTKPEDYDDQSDEVILDDMFGVTDD